MSATVAATRPSRQDRPHNAAASAHLRSPKGPRRRRFIDPTTCDRDYGPEELEFMQALERYKRSSGRMFPPCSEILEVVRSLGYQRDVTA
jgi:hypothetical protein